MVIQTVRAGTRDRTRKNARFSYSPTTHKVVATGRARGRHEKLDQNVTRPETEAAPSTPSPSSASSQSVTTPSPTKKRLKISSPKLKSPKTVLKSFLQHDKNAANANKKVIQQHRVHVKQTPKKDSRRFRDTSDIVALGLERLSTDIFNNPTWTNEKRKSLMEPHIMRYLNKNKDQGDKMIDMVEAMTELIKDLPPKDRRHILAIYTNHFTKNETEGLLSQHISNYEWSAARQHAKCPGPFEPVVKPKTRRARFKSQVVLEFLGHLNGYLQDHAYGDKNAVTSTGAMVQIDAVSTTASTSYIIDQYIKNCHPERLQRSEGGCGKKCPKAKIYCLKPDGHDGRCKFTDSTKMMSMTSIEKTVSQLTAGRLKSMAGLDDEDVKKGSGNLERVKEIYSLLATMNQLSDDAIEKMTSRITRILSFHRTGFITHLQRHGDRCCQCISCGLHCEDAPTHCPIRDDDSKCHGSPCKDCDESFKVFSDLLDLVHATQSLPHISSNERLNEQYHELEEELKTCQTNFIHWRSHIARKLVESQFSREQVQNLKQDEAIVICDFKMKILPILMKETKQDFFGKRGTACLGFMIITNQEQLEGLVDARFYLFFSDDTTQDTNFVLAGKHYIYSKILPSLFPDNTQVKVRFESDGAGSFNSNLGKAAMPFWEEWTDGKVVEIQVRHSVNGDGKSTLDALFGKLRSCFVYAVENGIGNVTDAPSCVKAIDEGVGIDGTSAFVLELNREYDLVASKKKPLLLKSHRIVYDNENNGYIAYRNSGYGYGTPIDAHSLKSMLDSSNPPQYNIIRSDPDTDICTNANQHSTEAYKSRLKRKIATKRDKANEKLVTAEENIVQRAKEKGLFLCDALDSLTKARCTYQCNSQEVLDRHKQSNKHTFPARSQVDEAVALASMEGGKYVAYQSRPNRNELHSNHTASDGPQRSGELEAHFDTGWACKPPPKDRKRLNKELVRILEEMYEAGERADGEGKKASNKYTPAAAAKIIRAMRNEAGLLKFSSTSDAGPAPTETQIKSFWGRYKKNDKKRDEWVEAAVECGNNEDEEDTNGVHQMGTDATNRQDNAHKKKQSKRKKTKGGKLAGKKFILDGEFGEEHGGEDGVVALIEQNGGTVNKRISKSVDYCVVGGNPTRGAQLEMYSVQAITCSQLRDLVNGQITFDSLLALLEDEKSTDLSSDICVESNDEGIEMSPKKGSKLFP